MAFCISQSASGLKTPAYSSSCLQILAVYGNMSGNFRIERPDTNSVSQKICLRSRLPILCTNVSVDPPDSYFEVQHVAASPCEIEIRMITGSGDSTQLTSRKKERSNPQVCVSLEGGRSIRIPIYSLDEVMRPAVGSKKE